MSVTHIIFITFLLKMFEGSKNISVVFDIDVYLHRHLVVLYFLLSCKDDVFPSEKRCRILQTLCTVTLLHFDVSNNTYAKNLQSD